MKKNIYILLTLVSVIFLSSCNDWLDQEDKNSISTKEAYSSTVGINSIASNLYSRLRYEQDFATDNESYDMTSWDEAINNSQYWAFATNKDQGYRSYYDYTLIREINLHIYNLEHSVGGGVDKKELTYFIAEARYMRAYVYFTLVSRMGGVPLITEVTKYSENPLDLAKPRNKESEIYDFIASELDSILTDLSVASNSIKTRATEGTALALKCRAMLYAGTLAQNYDKSAAKGLNLASGATGIDKNKANEYLQKCLDAYLALKDMNVYSLYKANTTDLASNYAEIFLVKNQNPEIIFYKDYNGKTIENSFTMRAICRTMKSETKSGSQINPVLNLVDSYELLSTHQAEKINPYNGTEHIEDMGTTTSSYDYIVYDNQSDIFKDRDPRLSGTILYPGSSFRGSSLDFQAGLAIKNGTSYTFKSAPTMEESNTAAGYYNNVKMTGEEGPHRISTYVSHSGFLLRKYVDVNAGTQSAGMSTVPYIVFRYGEVLLNAAEAAYYLSENGISSYKDHATRTLALDCVNEIRTRAGGASFAINDSELDLSRIINERKVELAFEDHRYDDLKRWRIADEVWAYDRNNENAVMYGLWPYKIYAPGDPADGKWIYRKVKIEHRGTESDKGRPINFTVSMYYATYPMNDGNPYIEKNPNQ
ncbi:MAG: RagB/SusD family nutrient uptake outer membrane protein [Dysgonomonas sp.]